ncbi:hypothetical protein LTR86_007622 [Recurvomyces mirabilis]|nr:hypothetical protein LTR86_007622 [Recurvomyces mirabilis]
MPVACIDKAMSIFFAAVAIVYLLLARLDSLATRYEALASSSAVLYRDLVNDYGLVSDLISKYEVQLHNIGAALDSVQNSNDVLAATPATIFELNVSTSNTQGVSCTRAIDSFLPRYIAFYSVQLGTLKAAHQILPTWSKTIRTIRQLTNVVKTGRFQDLNTVARHQHFLDYVHAPLQDPLDGICHLHNSFQALARLARLLEGE